MRMIFASMCLIATTTLTSAAPSHCQGGEPYYHHVQTGPGSVIADLFLFPMSLGVVVLTVPIAKRNEKGVYITAAAMCGPIHHAEQLTGNRPQPK